MRWVTYPHQHATRYAKHQEELPLVVLHHTEVDGLQLDEILHGSGLRSARRSDPVSDHFQHVFRQEYPSLGWILLRFLDEQFHYIRLPDLHEQREHTVPNISDLMVPDPVDHDWVYHPFLRALDPVRYNPVTRERIAILLDQHESDVPLLPGVGGKHNSHLHLGGVSKDCRYILPPETDRK